MATVSELVEMVGVVTMTEKKTVNAYARALIDAGALPKSRGRAVAHVQVEHAAKLLLAIALKPKIRVAAEMVDLWGSLKADTNKGRVTAMDVLGDLVGAASAGAIGDDEWTDVSVAVFEDRLGIDVHMPASRHGNNSDRVIKFRLSLREPLNEMVRFTLGPNPYFSRSASLSFDAFAFLCQLMNARQTGSTPKGDAAVKRLLSLRQIDPETPA